MKIPDQLELSEEKQFQWEILFERKVVREAEREEFSLPVWAGTWKIMNFVFRQQKQNWDCIWPDYQQNRTDKFDELQQLAEQVGISVITVTVTVSCFVFFVFCSFNFICHIEATLEIPTKATCQVRGQMLHGR